MTRDEVLTALEKRGVEEWFRSGAVIRDFFEGHASLHEIIADLVEALSKVDKADCPRTTAHPQSVWFNEHVQCQARKALDKFNKRMGGEL